MEPEREGDKGFASTLALVGSATTHLLLLLPVLYVVGLAFQSYSFFSWHPICMSLGAGLLVLEAVFSVSGEALLARKASRAQRVRLHWILHAVGIGLLLLGLLVVVVNKSGRSSEHLSSSHARLGLASILLGLLVAGLGVLGRSARARPVLLKVVHALAGVCATILFLASIVTGTHRAWWSHIGASETGRGLLFASLLVAVCLVLIKPVIGAAARTRVLVRPAPSAQPASSS